jgi:hypothetical protein
LKATSRLHSPKGAKNMAGQLTTRMLLMLLANFAIPAQGMNQNIAPSNNKEVIDRISATLCMAKVTNTPNLPNLIKDAINFYLTSNKKEQLKWVVECIIRNPPDPTGNPLEINFSADEIQNIFTRVLDKKNSYLLNSLITIFTFDRIPEKTPMIFKLAIMQDNLELLTSLININELGKNLKKQFKEIVEIAATSNAWHVLHYCLDSDLYKSYSNDRELALILVAADARREKLAIQESKNTIIDYIKQNRQPNLAWYIEDYISHFSTQDIEDIFLEFSETDHKNSFLLNNFTKKFSSIKKSDLTEEIFLRAVKQNNLELMDTLIHAKGLKRLFTNYYIEIIKDANESGNWPMLHYWLSHSIPIHSSQKTQSTFVATLFGIHDQLKRISNPTQDIIEINKRIESYFERLVESHKQGLSTSL